MEQTDGMSSQNNQNSQMKKNASDDQLFAAQQLAGLRAPGIRITIKSQNTSQQESRYRDIGKNLKQEKIQKIAHDYTLSSFL